MKPITMNNIICMVIVIAFVLLMTGCSTTKIKTKYVEIPFEVEKKCVSQYPDKILMRELKWVIVDNYWVALSPTGYENLSINTAEMLRYIKQANQVINKCRGEE